MPFNSVPFTLLSDSYLFYYALFCLRFLQMTLAEVWVHSVSQNKGVQPTTCSQEVPSHHRKTKAISPL